jgi:site-specific recombinase XerD
MKKKIFIRNLFHREEWKYGLYFDYDPDIIKLVKSIDGVAWSQTNLCWYSSKNEESLKRILAALRDKADIDISAISMPSEIRKINAHPRDNEGEMPSQLNKPDESENTDKSKTTVRVSGSSSGSSGYSSVSFSIDEAEGRLIIKFLGRYDKEWIDELRSYRDIRYDKIAREWSLRWSQLTVDSLSDYFSSRGIKVIVKKFEISPLIKSIRDSAGNEVRSRKISGNATEGLDNLLHYMQERRYSVRTINSYLSHLKFFFKYFGSKDPCEISDAEIGSFMHDFIVTNKYSASFQNQAISAIKMYYEIHEGREINSSEFKRPRKRRSLPKVFSKEEVMKIFDATRNSKHKLILWLIYSCGLRRSEVTNVRLTDLDISRGTLHIRAGKGNVDRIVPIPEKIWDKIKVYLKNYKPLEYLFEGQGGGRYSVESVYNIFKKSLHRAGINKEVGVHSLRHSYATHLHESGLDIRFIQELLGHKSTRTTEIYTHVSRKDLMRIKSPIEDMDIG